MGEKEMMLDQLLRSRWFVKIISFLLALLLYLGVTIDAPSTQPNTNPFLDFLSSKDEPKAFEEVELVANYDEDKYVVTGLPERVSIFLEGSESLITKAKLAMNYEAYVDLTSYDEGTHKVKVKHRNLPSKLTVKTDPEYVTITIQEKVSKLIPVNIQVINDSKLPLGYFYDEATVYPNSVTVTGAKSQVNKIALIKGYVNIAFAKTDIETSVPVFIYDAEGNELKGLDVYPAVLDVRVPITPPYKNVPLDVEEINNLPDGLSVVSIIYVPNTITIYGQKEAIEKYNYIDGSPLDLQHIDKNKEFTIDVLKPEDIVKVYPEKVKVRVQVAEEVKKSFTDVPIRVKGLSQGLEVTFLSPKDGQFSLDLLGAEAVLANVTTSELDTYVDVSDLPVGEHVVTIEFNGPRYVTWEALTKKVKIKISE
jgi:YbbR domain-containing protein